MKRVNFIFYGVILFMLIIAVSVFSFFGSKFLDQESNLVGGWKIEKVSSKPITDKKYYSQAQKQILIQRDSILHSKENSLFLDFQTSGFVFPSKNNGKLATNFFETPKPISWHFLKEKNQIALYRKTEPDVFWEIIKLSNFTLIIKTIYGNSEWVLEFSRLKKI